MNRKQMICSVVLLAALPLIAWSQAKTKDHTSRNKLVTVTLVRWPYT